MAGGVAQFLFTTLEEGLAQFSTSKTEALTGYALPIVGAGISIYIMLLGIQYARGQVQGALSDFALKIARMAVVLAIVSSSAAYDTYVVGFLSGIQSGITHALTGNTSPYEAIDNLGDVFTSYAVSKAKENGNWFFTVFGMDMVYTLLFGLCKIVMLVSMAVPLLMSYVNFYLTMTLGPIFILCLLFPVTNRLFDSWLSTALVALATQVAVSLIVAATTSAVGQFLTKMAQKFSVANTLSIALDALTLVTVLAFVGWKTGDLAAKWVGGSSMFNPLEKPAGAVLSAVPGAAKAAVLAVRNKLKRNKAKKA
jgi:type IV secretion system protein VirB6